VLWIELTWLDNLLYLDDASLARTSHVLIEVPCSLPENDITKSVSLPSLDDREITGDGLLHDVVTTIEVATFFRFGSNDSALTIRAKFDWEATFLQDSVSTSWGVESSHTSTATTNLLSQRALWNELYLKLAS